jgi:hypothetical protein
MANSGWHRFETARRKEVGIAIGSGIGVRHRLHWIRIGLRQFRIRL